MDGATGVPPAKQILFSDDGGPKLNGFLARPNFSAASGAGRNGIVLSHGFPGASQRRGLAQFGVPRAGHPAGGRDGGGGADLRLPGHRALAGEFSLGGWQADLAAAIGTLRAVPGIERTWLVGFAAGGTLSICAAGATSGGRRRGLCPVGRLRRARR